LEPMNHSKIPKYMAAVCREFGVDQDTILTKSKRKSIKEPRQLFYLICDLNGISASYIQDWVEKNGGVKQTSSTIIHGRKRAMSLMEEDPDLREFVENL